MIEKNASRDSDSIPQAPPASLNMTPNATFNEIPTFKFLKKIIEEQANDEGLWFKPEYASEAYLQLELRRLHQAVERALR